MLAVVIAMIATGVGGQGTVLSGMFVRDTAADVMKVAICVVSMLCAGLRLAVPARSATCTRARSRC